MNTVATTFYRCPYIAKSVLVNGVGLNFYFHRITTPEVTFYSIAVMDGNGTTHNFYMNERDGQWVLLAPQAQPAWIVTLEPELSQIILTHKATGTH